ncbi:hypothetical protein EW145_g6481 [Phellinidium pouzarii]|uniref:Uncharacterized protein n=1 Tax=Phellinidium pouzarii TaxID=167371 RepID=A0A4S4KX11_9AGAM|nr:hypothetical protein EW145_g6481 [Phellinidium pouzarii]
MSSLTQTISSLSSPAAATTVPGSSASSAATPTGSTIGDEGPPGISRSSSLLFGFLITFLALFVAFMACGYTSRRSNDLRRRGRQEMEQLQLQRAANMNRPRIWDVWIAEGQESWKGMMPLSATVKRSHHEEEMPPPPPPPPPPQAIHTALQEHEPPQEYFPSYITGGGGLSRIPSSPGLSRARTTNQLSPSSYDPYIPLTLNAGPAWLYSRLWKRRANAAAHAASAEDSTQGEEGKVEELRVAVLIAMPRLSPRKPKATSKADEEAEFFGVENHNVQGQDEYEIGVAEVHMPHGWDERNAS